MFTTRTFPIVAYQACPGETSNTFAAHRTLPISWNWVESRRIFWRERSIFSSLLLPFLRENISLFQKQLLDPSDYFDSVPSQFVYVLVSTLEIGGFSCLKMGLGGNSVQKPRHSRRRSDERVSMSGKPAGAKSEHDRREWTDRVEAPTLNDEYSVFAVKFEEMDNWRAFDGNYMRKVYVEIEIKTEGRVKAILLHARLPVNFEFALGASEPVQILNTEGRETAILLYRGMRWVDVERFKDLPAGDNTVNGKTSEKYAEGDPRDAVNLDGPKSLNKIRCYAERLANPQDVEGSCFLVIAFKNGRGASLRVASVKRGVYFEPKCE